MEYLPSKIPRYPLEYKILFHLKLVKSDYPQSFVRNLHEDLTLVFETLRDMEEYGFLQKIPSGMLKRKHVKLKRKLTTHQHHTYYELSREGDHFLRFIDTKEGKGYLVENHGEIGRILYRIYKGGPDYAAMTARGLGLHKKDVEGYYSIMEDMGMVERYKGSIIKAKERKLKPKKETSRQHTYYVPTREVKLIMRGMGE